MSGLPPGEILWEPAADARRQSQLGLYMDWLERERGLSFADYNALWRWSVDELEDFWRSIWDYFQIISHSEPTATLASAEMPGAVWFPGATLNYAEHALRHEDEDEVVLVARSQTREPIEMTRGELRDEVARVRAGLRRLGVGPGDRVAGYLANMPEAVIGLLASASLGAIWSTCPPEFGIQSVLDRVSQIEPKVLLVIDGYRYGEKEIDRTGEIAAIREQLPGLAATVVVPYLQGDPGRVPGAISWDELRSDHEPLEFEPVSFDHPLWILFSSGTTGLPKAIVHGHGGIILEHLKMGSLMQDIGPGERYFFFSTTAWMVWNRTVSSLLSGAGFAILDGDPTYPELDNLFDVVEQAGVTIWGVSAAYLALCQEAGLEPWREHDLSQIKAMVGAGSAVPLKAYRWVYDQVRPGVHFYSGSGGTDVCSGFVSGTPLSPVTAGEIPARMLGVMAEAYDEDGNALIDEPGDLVITKPMPSMPVGFWNDENDERFRESYFETYPGIWRHGDRFVLTSRGTCSILGRSDATLNRGGVRLGSGEFYTVVEAMPEVSDSVVVHVEDPDGRGGSLILLVALADGFELDEDLAQRTRRELRRQRSPRHVPDEIYAVPHLPQTLTGKKLEVPIKRILAGQEPEKVANRAVLEHPEGLDAIAAIAAERGKSTNGGKE
jgi:acetoacetyl-CoA synthetase